MTLALDPLLLAGVEAIDRRHAGLPARLRPRGAFLRGAR